LSRKEGKMITAELVKKLDNVAYYHDIQLYKLSEPILYGGYRSTEYIAIGISTEKYQSVKTSIFPANEKGNILDWNLLEGSYENGISHEQALEYAGITLIPQFEELEGEKDEHSNTTVPKD
jgi:hypothetical protein